MAGIVLAGVAGVVDWGKKRDTKAGARPPAALINLESFRVCFAALLKIGVMRIAAGAVKKREKNTTCLIKLLGSGCKKRELLKARGGVGLVHPVSWSTPPAVSFPPSA